MSSALHAGLKTALAVLLAGGTIALGVRWLERPPAGPVEPAWDRDHCAHCHMAVSDPHFAAEIQTADGRVLFFDDPGCLLHYEAEQHPAERAVYFHHARADRWLPRAAAGFVRGARTPMDWGLAAVDAGEATIPAALAGVAPAAGSLARPAALPVAAELRETGHATTH